jgi:peroxiredoxin (alkyl hydroperoxide reductase subunit C)
MTALCLDFADEHRPVRDLHEWLGGAWALLFSNPEDFQPQSHGRDKRRWLDGLRREFSARAVCALAVKRDSGPQDSSWIEELQRAPNLVRLREPAFAAADEVSFAARALRGELLTLRSRFALVIDGALKRRVLLKYGTGDNTGSVLDLLASVDALRRHAAIRRAA